jgi:hypothetical protein
MNMVAAHHIEPTATGCVNRLTLDVSGGLTPILGRVLRGQFARSIATENAGFKSAAEAVSLRE